MNDAPTLPGTRIAVVGAGAIGLAHIAVNRASATSTLSGSSIRHPKRQRSRPFRAIARLGD